MVYKLAVWTGPTLVKAIARAFTDAGVEVTCEGTERVHILSEGSDACAAMWNALCDLQRRHGTDYGLGRGRSFSVMSVQQ